MRTVFTAAVLVAGSLLGACGGPATPAATGTASQVANSTPAASQSAAATASPSPTEMTRQEAAATYLRIVAPANAAGRRFPYVTTATRDLREANAAAAAVAKADRQFSLDLQARHWPASVQPAVDRLVVAVTTASSAARMLAATQTAGDYIVAWERGYQPANAAAGAAADLVRQQLGLPAGG